MFAIAVEHECKWTRHIVGDDIFGITTIGEDVAPSSFQLPHKPRA
ncbi:hypothetical protein [Nostoc sp.]